MCPKVKVQTEKCCKCMSSAMECIKCLGSTKNARQLVVSEAEMLKGFRYNPADKHQGTGTFARK